jgi:hypothetical protein
MENIEFRLTEELLQALFQGKKVEMISHGPLGEATRRATIYPPWFGVFMTWEKFAELERMAMVKAYKELVEIMEKAKSESKHTSSV